MAGIGFTLRNIARQDSLSGVAQALVFSSLIAAGPWIVSVVALGLISLMIDESESSGQLSLFRAIVTYNFQFAPILISIFSIIATRYFSDEISRENLSGLSGLIFGGLVLSVLILVPCSILLYLVVFTLPSDLAIAAMLNFVSIGIVWYLSTFASAVRDYVSVCLSFLFGFGSAVIGCVYFADQFGAIGMITSLTVSLLVIAATLLARLTSMLDTKLIRPFAFLQGYREYPELAFGGFIFSLAIWIDKWIMCLAPEATYFGNGFKFFTGYETAMFLAGLAGIPVLGMFVLCVETGFYERCRAFNGAILKGCSFDRIEPLQRELIRTALYALRNYLVLQVFVTVILIFLTPQLFEAFQLKFEDIGMFRFALCGNLFFLLLMFCSILLSYFDARRDVCIVQSLFFILNGLFSFYSLRLGREYYGYGFFVASTIGAAISVGLLARTLHRLPYHTFVVCNAKKRHLPLSGDGETSSTLSPVRASQLNSLAESRIA